METPAGVLTCKAVMLISSLNLPARALVSNMKQFNGRYECSWCEIEGKSSPNLQMITYFPHCSPSPTQRYHLSMLLNAGKAVTNKEVVSS